MLVTLRGKQVKRMTRAVILQVARKFVYLRCLSKNNGCEGGGGRKRKIENCISKMSVKKQRVRRGGGVCVCGREK